MLLSLAAMNTLAQAPIVIAHRGASGYLPEHTLAAKAMAHAMGADYIEQDVVLSSDGVPLVLHDIHLDTTTDVARRFPARARDDGRYYAIDFSLEEIRQLRVHERRAGATAGEAAFPHRFPLGPGMMTVPTLAEEIDLIAGLDHSRGRRTGLYIELKAPTSTVRRARISPVAYSPCWRKRITPSAATRSSCNVSMTRPCAICATPCRHRCH
ncbi:glycerophosphodiester phosphodiesterase family protein [Kineobactrum salinum]|uniref:glycerophosphodiester phosphodiesterase family protein n=1 Tax=Kineobactrum salinum TaxID=2708301 RepID=UPI0022B2A941|nr:glycerophosphodiester phosphodiesterase family protein [Kineobactrum salinum]